MALLQINKLLNASFTQLPYHQRSVGRAGFRLGASAASWVDHERQLH